MPHDFIPVTETQQQMLYLAWFRDIVPPFETPVVVNACKTHRNMEYKRRGEAPVNRAASREQELTNLTDDVRWCCKMIISAKAPI